ncbi:MAG TPA: hypothetical protein PLZ57_08680 [Pseudobdellovibrionaceae bacterium]|nr:hypothetical protein [Pseudobdellovibrionaceae bacterium]
MEDSSQWVIIAGGIVFVLGIVAYIVIMLLFPEWVGITGKVALEAERAHRGETHEATSTTPPAETPAPATEASKSRNP